MKNNNLIIRLNQNPSPNACPFCGVQTNPNIGAELFLAETEAIVCIECGSHHAPILAALITFADFSRLFQETSEPIHKRMKTYFDLSKLLCEAEKEFGAKWEANQNIKRIPKNSFGLQEVK